MGNSGWSQQDSNASFRMFLTLPPAESLLSIHSQQEGAKADF